MDSQIPPELPVLREKLPRVRRRKEAVATSNMNGQLQDSRSDGLDQSQQTRSRPATQRKPRSRRGDSQTPTVDNSDGKSVSAFKPLNFAPPKSFKQTKDTPDAAVISLEGRSGQSESKRRVRTKPKSASAKKQSPSTAMNSQDTNEKSETVTASTTKTVFQAPTDPFPNDVDALAASTEAFTLSDTSSIRQAGRSKQQTATTKNAVDQGEPTRSRTRGKREAQEKTNEKSTRKPERRARPQRDQIPSSIFENQTVTRGLHGRLVFSSNVTSNANIAESVAQTLHEESSGSTIQRAQFATGPGILEQDQLNRDADLALLKYQKSLSFAPPSQDHTLQDGAKKRGAQTRATDVNGNKSKKAYFAEHISREDALVGLKAGKYYQGPIRINQKARNDAWVTVSSKALEDSDILVEGEKDRNRSLNGDEVVIELITDSDANHADQASEKDQKHEGRTRGRVVHILSQRPLQRISGFIRPPGWIIGTKKQDDRAIIANSAGKNTCTFHPQDQRIPWLTVSLSDIPKDLQGPNWAFNLLQKQRTIYAARIVAWQTHSRTPRGAVVDELGVVGNIETETAAILVDCDVDVRDHPMTALACLPKTPWSISQEEISKRRDFRKDRVCTIDPETARDLDDALSVRRLDDGNYEIGVHIADVSHFIEQGNALDQIAQTRATTVYMVQKAIPMLPRLLCEELCSLNPAVDRLAFSVTWTLNEDGEEVGPRWYGRSIIRSAVRFAYGEAQNLLDGKSWAEGVGKTIDGGHTEEEITSDIKVLLRMSKAMRKRRFDNGALTINAFKLNFRLDKNGVPGVAEVYQLKDANRLIEEFMLKANISVAEKIVDSYPEHALLRMHPPPKDRPLKEFVNYAQKLGIHIDSTSSATMQEGFNNLSEMAKTNPMVAVLQNNAVRSMRRAEYMCTGLHEDRESWAHYALAVPLYTHFTSPIRRYADVVVHRLLDHALKAEAAGFEADDCEEWAKNCNVRKENARTAQDRSSMLYLCAFIEENCRKDDRMGLDTGMEVEAIIIAVRDRSIDIIIPEMALEKRIYYDDSYSILSISHDLQNETTQVNWRTEQERLEVIKKLEEDEDSSTLSKHTKDESKPAGAEEEAAGNHTDRGAHSTTLHVMDKIRVWLRGDFEVSPCQVNAGFVMP